MSTGLQALGGAREMLPALFLDGEEAKKKQRKDASDDDPKFRACPGELRYEDGDRVIVDKWGRKQGSSVSFSRTQPVVFPAAPKTWEEVAKYWSGLSDLHYNFQKVVENAYRLPTPAEERKDPRGRPNEAIVRKRAYNPQYRARVLQKEATLVHIINSDTFGADWYTFDDIEVPEKNEVLYTNGCIWTNTDPEWRWEGTVGEDHCFRCRIKVPAERTVVMDMSPVREGLCQFDEGRTSFFPDVILLPAKFVVTSVEAYDSATPPPFANGYAWKTVGEGKRLVDVELTLLDTIALPENLKVPESYQILS